MLAHLTSLGVENYKGLRDVEIPLSPFVCLIGENNAGKSSLLQALSLLASGSSLSKAHYFDETKPIRIALSLEGVTDEDIAQLAPEHQAKFRGVIREGRITFVRLYGTDGKGKLKYLRHIPRDGRFSDESVAELVRGKRSGQSFVDAVVARFPELDGHVSPAMTQTDVRDAIRDLADALPDAEKEAVDADLPSGIDKSASALLPGVIYVPAVKDLRDDVKTTETTPFGRVLGILLREIEPLLEAERAIFERLNARLNRVVAADGTETDGRLQPVKSIEETVERFVRESFGDVRLKISIPPPELKTVLSSATIIAYDGVEGPLDTKGDGLKRAVIFAILRSYLELRKARQEDGEAAGGPRHLLLFEEPELYLHPRAQGVLFEALGEFSREHTVVVTTHSPAFFGPGATTTFVKLKKRADDAIARAPYTEALPVNLRDVDARDEFQIVCYENNNIAFFAETVALVEGDSDYIVLPHLARLLDPAWDCVQRPVRFARIGGKGSVRRYREFFRRFGMRVALITDLDFLLGAEFAQVEPSARARALREQLLRQADDRIEAVGGGAEPSPAHVRNAQQRPDVHARWREARRLKAEFDAGRIGLDQVAIAVDAFFAWERYWPRRDLLKECPNQELLTLKRALLDLLRSDDVFVLERGAIDDYYPGTVVGRGKTERAQCFCRTVTTREQALALCGRVPAGGDAGGVPEFEVIFRSIFDGGAR